MVGSRRQFLKVGGAVTAYGALGMGAFAAEDPALGLIFPPL